jgi:hypothetical protein
MEDCPFSPQVAKTFAERASAIVRTATRRLERHAGRNREQGLLWEGDYW